jgi:small subunit ribosomal protein S3
MGQKVNPIGFRLQVNRDWRSRWYASRKDFADYLLDDCKIREKLKGKLRNAAVSRITIERAWNSVRVTVYTARPGAVIGRKGQEIESLTKEVSDIVGNKQVKIDIVEIKRPDLDAQLVAENVASQLERRISFRRAMKRTVQVTMDGGALGVKIRCSGRLGGAEIARTEWYREGKVPLHTLRTPIDYGFAEANTVAGKIGIKCWICRPEEKEEANGTVAAPTSAAPAPAPVEA